MAAVAGLKRHITDTGSGTVISKEQERSFLTYAQAGTELHEVPSIAAHVAAG